jgi:YD repeat-containing protein
MKITYDAEVDALYIQFLETTVTTEHLAEGIAADYDAQGKLAGIEILDALKRFGDPMAQRPLNRRATNPGW